MAISGGRLFAATMAVLALLATVTVLLAPRWTRATPHKGRQIMFETVIVGQLGVNCFILGCPDTREGIVVDAGADPEQILAAIKKLGLTIRYVISTHGHFDHVGANRRVLEATGARYLIHEADLPWLSRASQSAASYGLTADNSPAPDQYLTDGMTVTFGNQRLTVLHTPGHTPGGCSLYLADQGLVLTGDTLFADSVGRTDLPGGSHEQLVASIRAKLYPLPEATIVYPGHGPASSIGREKRHNPYVSVNP